MNNLKYKNENTAKVRNSFIVTMVNNNNHSINPEYREYMRTTSYKSDVPSWMHSDHKPILIGRKCWITSDVRIQKGVSIGDISAIAACSVVTKDVPANSIAIGNPTKTVKTDIDKIQIRLRARSLMNT